MNILASLLVLFVFVSCGNNDSKKEKCVYNGQQISCKDMPGNNQPQISALKGTVLKAQVKAAMSMDASRNRFEIIENSFDSSSASAGDVHVSCGVQTRSGQVVTYRVNDTSAEMIINNERHRMKRLAGNRNSIVGLWADSIVKDGIEQAMEITILEASLRIEVTCTVL